VTSDDLVNGGALLIAIAVGVWGSEPRARSSLAIVGGVLLLTWHEYVTSWPNGNAVSAFTARIGYPISFHDVWLAFDAVAAGAGMYAWLQGRSWAGLAIYVTATAMVVMHLIRWDVPLIGDPWYYDALGWLFRAQVVALFMAGGRGVAGFVGDLRALGARCVRAARHRPASAVVGLDAP
jgi:hypothetical protein